MIGSKSQLLDALKSLKQLDLSSSELRSLSEEYPVILAQDCEMVLHDAVCAHSQDERTVLADRFARLRPLGAQLEEQCMQLRGGKGPIERIFEALASGKIKIRQATDLARSDDLVWKYSPYYCKAMSSFCRRVVVKDMAVRWHLVVQAAVDGAMSRPGFPAVAKDVFLDWLEIAHDSLFERPSKSVYNLSIVKGQKLLEQSDDKDFLGALNFGLGAVLLDIHVAERSTVPDFQQKLKLWQRKFVPPESDDLEVFLGADAVWMPEPIEAMKMACGYLRRSAQLTEGNQKGRALKALAQGLFWLGELEEVVDPTELRDVVTSCRALLDPVQDAFHLNWLDSAFPESQGGDAKRKIADSDKDMRVPLPKSAAGDIFSLVHDEQRRFWNLMGDAEVTLTSDPEKCLQLIAQAESHAKNLNDQDRIRVWKLQLRGLTHKHGKTAQKARNARQLSKKAEKCIRAAHKGLIAKSEAATYMLALALQSQHLAEERLGLDLLYVATVTDCELTKAYFDAFRFLQGSLWCDVGAEAALKYDFESALEPYSKALEIFSDIGLGTNILDLLTRLLSIALQSNPIPDKLVVAIALGIYCLETRPGTVDRRVTQELSGSLVCKIIENREFRHLPDFIRNVKGSTFGTLVKDAPAFDWRSDAVAGMLLQQIDQLSSDLSVNTIEEPGKRLDDNALIASAVSRTERHLGQNAAEQLENLQAEFDQHLQIKNAVHGGKKSFLGYFLPELKLGELGHRTVLMEYFTTHDAQNDLVAVCMLHTNDLNCSMFVDPTILPEPKGRLIMRDEPGGRQIITSHLALSVRAFRNELLMESGPQAATLEAVEAGRRLQHALLRSAESELERLQNEGKDHLCIVAHGPLHFLPWHLLGYKTGILADYWTVTSLPNAHLLARERRGGAGETFPAGPICVFGHGFGGTSDGQELTLALPSILPPIPAALEEANAVARVFDVHPITGSVATADALLSALQNSRFVHVSSHGAMNAAAPSFQVLYLNDNPDDGRIYAYELLPNNFKAQLVTLSACETALGRFDHADNLLGFSANLFQGGVSTVIGTLWETNAEASLKFFTEFYTAIKREESMVNAFRLAQIKTRELFHQYRDWGAFYFSGEWR